MADGFGYSFSWKKTPNNTVTVNAQNYPSPKEALEAFKRGLFLNGYTVPRFWQYWRWGEHRLVCLWTRAGIGTHNGRLAFQYWLRAKLSANKRNVEWTTSRKGHEFPWHIVNWERLDLGENENE